MSHLYPDVWVTLQEVPVCVLHTFQQQGFLGLHLQVHACPDLGDPGPWGEGEVRSTLTARTRSLLGPQLDQRRTEQPARGTGGDPQLNHFLALSLYVLCLWYIKDIFIALTGWLSG